MTKYMLTLALSTLLMACGGGSSGGDSADSGSSGTNYCAVANNAIELASGEQCVISESTASTYRMSEGTVSCSSGTITYNGSTLSGGISFNGLTLSCN